MHDTHTLRRFQALLLSLMALPLSAPALPGGADSSSYTIGKITIVQRPVFDEKDSTLFNDVGKFSRPLGELGQTLRGVANDVHVQTQDDVIRRELLFKEGDPYDPRLVDESARCASSATPRSSATRTRTGRSTSRSERTTAGRSTRRCRRRSAAA